MDSINKLPTISEGKVLDDKMPVISEEGDESVIDVDSLDDRAAPDIPIISSKKAALIEDIINVFTMYHQKWYNQEKSTSILHGVDYDKQNSTTLMMESLYNEMYKQKIASTNNRLISIYSPDDMTPKDKSSFDELYLLEINGKTNKLCPRLLPLVSYTASLNWRELDWKIIPIRRNFE